MIAQKVFYAHYHDKAGYLTKQQDGNLLFLAHDSMVPDVIEPEDLCWLAVLGQVDVATAQWITDLSAGGYASVACQRQQGVA